MTARPGEDADRPNRWFVLARPAKVLDRLRGV